MRQLLFVCFIAVNITCYSTITNRSPCGKNTNPFDSLGVILALGNTDYYQEVKSVIQTLSGVKYVAYCDNHSVFMLYIDKIAFNNRDLFLEKLLKLCPQASRYLFIKEGVIPEFVPFCEPQNSTDAQTIKENFGK